MREVTLFVEDFGHEVFLKALLDRLANFHGIEIHVKPRSTRAQRGRRPNLHQHQERVAPVPAGFRQASGVPVA